MYQLIETCVRIKTIPANIQLKLTRVCLIKCFAFCRLVLGGRRAACEGPVQRLQQAHSTCSEHDAKSGCSIRSRLCSAHQRGECFDRIYKHVFHYDIYLTYCLIDIINGITSWNELELRASITFLYSIIQ